MNRSKRRSRRLALYLRSIEFNHRQQGFTLNTNALEPEQRKLARKTGRRLIKEAGSIAKTVATLTNPVVQETRRAPLVVALTRAKHEKRRSNTSPGAGPRSHLLVPLVGWERLSQTFLAHPGMGRRGLGETARS